MSPYPRAATEQKTISLLEDVRRKWSRAEEERMEVVRAELAKERERAEEQEGKWRESQVCTCTRVSRCAQFY